MKKDEHLKLAFLWLKTAQDDLLWGQDDFKNRWYSRVCFISQQAAEKALKSFLFFKKEPLLKTHNLLALLKRCEKYNKKFASLLNNCKILNSYYTDTRYPDIWDISRFDDKNLAKEALKLAKQVVNFAEKNLNSKKN